MSYQRKYYEAMATLICLFIVLVILLASIGGHHTCSSSM